MQKHIRQASFILSMGLGLLILNFCSGNQNWAIRETKAQSQSKPKLSENLKNLPQSYEIRKFISGSMEPTLKVYNRVFIDKSAYLETQPKRGDIILYSLPAKQGKRLYLKEDLDSIHRIIGLPGETISVADGHVMIDDRLLKEDYLVEEIDYQLAPTVIPDDAYFLLGDNRNVSLDSHIWGSISQDRILGQAIGVLCPPEHQKLFVSSNSLSPEIQKLWPVGKQYFQDLYDSSQSCDAPTSTST